MHKSFMSIGMAAVVAVALIAGCGGANTTAPSGTQPAAPNTPSAHSDHNQADVAFVQQMIPHHQGAIDMAKLVPGRSTNPKVQDLATRIENAQNPEIQQMNGWLTQWGVPAATTMPSMPGMDHGSTSMPGMGSTGSIPGMASDAERNQLAQAKGVEFDRMWLEMMINHHQGAVTMAKTELRQGSNADAKALAQKIIDAQQAEINEMQGLLK